MSRSRPDPDAILQRLEWTVLRRLDGYLQGNYRSLFRGFGLDLADLREYELHDDVRRIDWNVTARMQVPYVREYDEDREITAWILLDMSPSMEFGSEQMTKRMMLAEMTAVMARLTVRNGNRVGALFSGGSGLDRVIQARSGRRQVLSIMDEVLRWPVLERAPATDLSAFLRDAFHVIRRRSLVILISDFVSAPGWAEPLSVLAERHEILAVRVFDPLERILPSMGLMVVQDAETGDQLLVDTADRRFRKRFMAAAERYEETILAALGGAGVDAFELSTTDDLVDCLLRFADLRKRRSARAVAGGPERAQRRVVS
jgi:uncharacterized protein (DUF58 family)